MAEIMMAAHRQTGRANRARLTEPARRFELPAVYEAAQSGIGGQPEAIRRSAADAGDPADVLG